MQSDHTCASPPPVSGASPAVDPTSSTLSPPLPRIPTVSPTPNDPEQVSVSSPADEPDSVFYDAQDNLIDEGPPPLSPALAPQQIDNETEFGTGTGSALGHGLLHTTPASPVPPRGASASAASPASPSVVPLLDQARRNFPLSLVDGSVSHEPIQKAVAVGINYVNLERDRQLNYGVKDATRFAGALKERGFPEENIVVLTDDPSQEAQKCPTFVVLKMWIEWLLHDAKAGDTLVFFFSGHGLKLGEFIAGLIAADGTLFDRFLLHKHLVSPVPAGCELHVMLDCCHASAIIQLQYCVGRMMPKPAAPQSESGQPATNHTAPPRRPRGSAVIAAAPPPPPNPSAGGATETEATWSGYLASLVGMGQAPVGSSATPRASTSGEPQHGRQAVLEVDCLPDYFEERKEGFVKPSGCVVLWAGTGEEQRAFEAHHRSRTWNGVKIRVQNGIVTHALCSVLAARINQRLTVRDLWTALVVVTGQENRWRSKRDAKKPERPDPKGRVQQPELWVSQPQPLRYAAPALDRSMF